MTGGPLGALRLLFPGVLLVGGRWRADSWGLIVLTLCCVTWPMCRASGPEGVLIGGMEGSVDIGRHGRLLRDPARRMTLTNAMKVGDALWVPLPAAGIPSLGFTDDALWVRYRLVNVATNGVRVVLELRWGRFAELDWYVLRGATVVASESMGLLRAGRRRGGEGGMDSRLPSLGVEIGAGETLELYMRAWTPASVLLPLRVHSSVEAFGAARLREEGWVLAGAGLMAGVLAAAVALGWLLDEKMFLVNAGLVLVHGLLCFVHGGYWTWLGWPWADVVVWMPLTALHHVCSFMATWFTLSFLSRGPLGRESRRVLVGMLVGLAGMAAALLALTHRPSPDLPEPTRVAATVGWLRGITQAIGGVNTANVVVFFTCAGLAAWQWVAGRHRAASWLVAGWGVCGLLRLQLGLQWQGTVPVVIHPSTGLLLLSMIMPSFFLVSATARFRVVAMDRQRALRLEQTLAEARLRALRYQMNPHFLFNSLNSAMGLLLEDASRVPGFLLLLSRFVRSSLDGNPRGLVSVERELQITRDYLAIERVRFEKRLEVDINMPQSLMGMEMPEMVLQPLLENALRHGSRNAAKVLCVRMRAWVEEGRMHVEVANTGRLRARAGQATWTESEEGGVGLANLRERLALVHAGRASLAIGEADGWVTVRLVLPARLASSGPDAAEEAIP
jgi:hypothetical protein